MISLGEVARPTGHKSGTIEAPVYSVTKHRGFVPSLEYFSKQVFSRELGNYKLVNRGDFAYATIHLDEGSIGIAPERALISPMYTAFSVDNDRVDSRYLIRFLKSPIALSAYATMGRGSAERRRTISFGALSSLEVPLPPLAEQRRIAAILDQADALRTKRRESIALLVGVTNSVFLEMFGKTEMNDRGWSEIGAFGEVADIVGGITKGRKSNGQALRKVPYLAVSNVKEGYLDLETVKSIDATDAEIDRYRLVADDILLTEGGDPDKLGRGTLWSVQLPEAIHQNHIFRARINDQAVTPLFARALLSSERGRKFFLKSAKQTTGIASINKSQLGSFPMLAPPRSLQETYANRVRQIELSSRTQESHLAELDALFASLQHRAFQGTL